MKSLVVDSSTTLGFLLRDERSPLALKTLALISKADSTFVPSLWWLEIANGLLMAERRKRVTYVEAAEAYQLGMALPLITDDQTSQRGGTETWALAREYALTIYDAIYLELAIRHGAALATVDKALARAARSAGVELLV